MNKFRYTLIALAILSLTLMVSSSAQAQATRTWVSGVGNDADPCSRTAPCKTYAGAITKTAKDGEISTLDPGGFGTVTLTKSVTINGGNGGQGYGSILASLATTGVIINITDAADVRKSVKLDWLNINGASTGTDGIRMVAGDRLHIENCLIDGMAGDGIELTYSAANANTVLLVHNTTIRNCVGAGIKTDAFTGGKINATINNAQVTKCGVGIDFIDGTVGNVVNSVIASCTSHGVQVAEPTSGSVANVIGTTIASNAGTGVNVVGGSRARIARNNIFGNNVSLAPAANVDSGGNNSIAGNTTNTAPAGGTPFPQN